MEVKLQFIPAPVRGQEIIVLLATAGMRDGPSSPLAQLVREFEPYWRGSNPTPIICAGEGSFRTILRSGCLLDYPEFHWLPPGFRGSLVYASDLVITHSVPEPGIFCEKDACTEDDYPVRVFYLIDPADPTSIYPETVALKRDCVVAGKTFLATRRGVSEWLTLQWYRLYNGDPPTRQPRWCLTTSDISAVRSKLPSARITEPSIALVAHDKKKSHLLEFAQRHFDYLKKEYAMRYATGTTGSLLNGIMPDREVTKDPEELDRLKQLTACLARKIGQGQSWVESQPSGPRGGDVQIARRILDRQCGKVLFFEDPHYAREHEADIQLLERTSRITDLGVLCIHDRRSAETWASNWEVCIDKDCHAPMTLVEAYRQLFDVELIIAKGRPDATAVEEEAWRSILRAAGHYVQGLISSLVRRRRREPDVVRIGVTWGLAIRELIDEFRRIAEILTAADERISQDLCRIYSPLKDRMEEAGQWPLGLTEQLSAPQFLKPGNVLAVPVVGIMGATNPRVEANRNADYLVEMLGGATRHLSESAFQERLDSEIETSLEFEWDALDVVIYTCECAKPRLGSKVFAEIPDDLWQRVKDSVGEIGGMYLREDGREYDCGSFVRRGISHAAVRAVARRGGAVLVAGAQERRLRPALAALRGKLVSTLVTDLDFAWKLFDTQVRR
ncbi:MAG: hypothetical protein AB1714_31890 [Acidobacteriota bacterium]